MLIGGVGLGRVPGAICRVAPGPFLPFSWHCPPSCGGLPPRGAGESLLICFLVEGPEAPEDFCTGVSAVEGLSPVSLEEGWVLDSRASVVGGDWAQECRPVGSVVRDLHQLHGAA